MPPFRFSRNHQTSGPGPTASKRSFLTFSPVPLEKKAKDCGRNRWRVHERVEALLGDVPRLELFARETWSGWISWGNESTKFAVGPIQAPAPVGSLYSSRPVTCGRAWRPEDGAVVMDLVIVR